MPRRRVAACLLVLMGACGGKSRGPAPTPVADPPQITCPADVRVSGVSGTSQSVDFPAPTVTGGTAPVTTTCTQTPGASFPLGTTAINCAANDAASRQASCAFNVTLTGFSIEVVKYEAFGDSLTEGEIGTGVGPRLVDPPNSYPTKLQTRFDSLFPGQGVVVLNQGVSGQLIETTRDRMPGLLARDRPQAVLLLGGYNNLTLPCGPGQGNTLACGDATDFVAFGIRDCIRKAKESPVGVKYVFVSTLTPPGSGPRRIDGGAIIETNKKIRQMVSSERVTLVDAHPIFVGHEAEYVSADGLHLNPAGYQALADAFFAAIKATVPQTPLFSKGTSQ